MSAVSSRNRWFWTQLLIRPLGLGNLRDRRAVLPHESHDFLQLIFFCAKAFDAGIVRVLRAVLHCETLFGTQTTLVGPQIGHRAREGRVGRVQSTGSAFSAEAFSGE